MVVISLDLRFLSGFQSSPDSQPDVYVKYLSRKLIKTVVSIHNSKQFVLLSLLSSVLD